MFGRSLARIASISALALAGWAAAPGAAQAVPAFANASFEDDDWIALVGPVTPSGWSSTASGTYPRGADDANSGSGPGTDYETPFGDQFVIVESAFSGGGDSLSQTVGGFTVGATYALSFWMSPSVSVDNSAGTANHVLDLTIADALLDSATERFGILTGPTGTGTWNYWEERTHSFVATTSSMTFTFQGVEAHGVEYCGYSFCRGAGLDNLSLTETAAAVPEPAPLAVLGLGVAALALARRRC